MYGLLPASQIKKRLKEFIKTELDGICPPLKYYKVKKDDNFENLDKGDEILIIEDSEKKFTYFHLTMRSDRLSLSRYTCFLHKASEFQHHFNEVCYFSYFQIRSLTADARGAYIETSEDLERVLILFKESLNNIIMPLHYKIQTLRDIYEFEKNKYYKEYVSHPSLMKLAYLLLHQKICEPQKVELTYAAIEKLKAKLKSELSQEDFKEELSYMLPVMKEFDSFKDNQELIDRGWLTKEDVIPSFTPEEVEDWYRKTSRHIPEERDKLLQDFVDMYGFRL